MDSNKIDVVVGVDVTSFEVVLMFSDSIHAFEIPMDNAQAGELGEAIAEAAIKAQEMATKSGTGVN